MAYAQLCSTRLRVMIERIHQVTTLRCTEHVVNVTCMEGFSKTAGSRPSRRDFHAQARNSLYIFGDKHNTRRLAPRPQQRRGYGCANTFEKKADDRAQCVRPGVQIRRQFNNITRVVFQFRVRALDYKV
jgi:hypothetical protein